MTKLEELRIIFYTTEETFNRVANSICTDESFNEAYCDYVDAREDYNRSLKYKKMEKQDD